MKWLACGAALLLALVSGCSSEPAETPPETREEVETRIVRYLGDNVRAGEPVVVSELSNVVFTSPEERAALDRMFNTFFKIPMFLVQFQSGTGELPTLVEISEQFNFTIPGQTEVMLQVMESDPRIPRFFERDPDTGEITSLDVDRIVNDPQFGQTVERSLAGWEGRRLPEIAMATLAGGEITSEQVAGRPHMLYVWFSNCPPCLETAPLLVELYGEYAGTGFEIIAANADRILELPYDDEVRSDYVEQVGIEFVTAHLTGDLQNALGGVSIFPTMFFVDGEGVVVRHFVNFQEKSVLEEAIQATL